MVPCKRADRRRFAGTICLSPSALAERYFVIESSGGGLL